MRDTADLTELSHLLMKLLNERQIFQRLYKSPIFLLSNESLIYFVLNESYVPHTFTFTVYCKVA